MSLATCVARRFSFRQVIFDKKNRAKYSLEFLTPRAPTCFMQEFFRFQPSDSPQWGWKTKLLLLLVCYVPLVKTEKVKIDETG